MNHNNDKVNGGINSGVNNGVNNGINVNLNQKTKQVFITQNITACKLGFYMNCPTSKALKTTYVSNFSIPEAQSIADVYIVNSHPIDLVSEFCNRGINVEPKDGLRPVVMCTVNRETFFGTNFNQSEGMIDDLYNLRCNYNMITQNGNPFPIKDKESIYNKFLTVIRDQKFNPIPLQNTYTFSVITISSIHKPPLVDENRMGSVEFLNLMSTVETLFQTAIYYGHNVLILSPIGYSEDDVPQEDVIKIYNCMIFKYQHMFRYIVVAVPEFIGSDVYALYESNIIIPQEIASNDTEEITVKIKNNKHKNKNVSNDN